MKGRDDLVRRGGRGEGVSLHGLTLGDRAWPWGGEVERLVLLDSIRCDGAHSSFLLNTAEGSGDLAGEQTSALTDKAARLNKQRRPWYEGKTRKGSKDGWAPEVRHAPGMPKESTPVLVFCFFFNNKDRADYRNIQSWATRSVWWWISPLLRQPVTHF